MPEQQDAHPTPAHAQRRAIRDALLAWFQPDARTMPWRQTEDPYKIWVSEIMLQQTRVNQARPYYERFIEAFPTVEALADATRDQVLKCWEGLGYYSRARYLHRASWKIVNEFDGQFPDTEAQARTLPGVGPYTAAAVLSIAFDRPLAVLDGNVARVLSRVFTIEEDIKASATRKTLQHLADALLSREAPGDFNQAMMELGATVCIPKRPACHRCPIRSSCGAFLAGNPEEYPVSAKKKPIPHHDVAIGLVFDDRNRLLIARRPDEGLLGGLWEFPGGKRMAGEPLEETCRRELREELGIVVKVGRKFHRLAHAYTHFKITLHAFLCRIESGTPESSNGQPFAWVTDAELDDYAFPRANRKLIERLHARRTSPTLFQDR